MGEFANWLKETLSNLLHNAIEALWNLLVYLIQAIVDFLAFLVDSVAGAFEGISKPTIPTLDVDAGIIDTGIMGFARWILPIDIMIVCLTIVTTYLALYFTVGILLRWAKVSQ